MRLRNISIGGCELERVWILGACEHVVTCLPGLEPLGDTVAWADARCAGVRFDRPLRPVFEQLLGRLV